MKKGYKAYEKGLVCRGKQYKIGEIFEESRAEICEAGMHYCENPLDCLDYYPLIDSNGELVEMTEVEDLDSENREAENNRKFCTKKLKIGAKLSLGDFIKAGFDFIYENFKKEYKYASIMSTSIRYSRLAASCDYSQLANSGSYSQLVSIGDYSQLANSGDYSQLANSGDYSRLANSGDYSQLASIGYGSKLVSAGNYSQIISTNNYSYLANTGGGSRVSSTGHGSRVVGVGNYSYSASTGESCIVVNIGNGSLAKAGKGSWITLAEYDDTGLVSCVKTEQVDGERIKEDTWYKLVGGEFVEV